LDRSNDVSLTTAGHPVPSELPVRSSRARKAPATSNGATPAAEASAPDSSDETPAPAVKPKRKRATKPPGERRPTKKATALTAGAPSVEVQIWDKDKMAAAVAYLRTCDPGGSEH